METWTQNYAAVGNSTVLTALIALLPIIFFFIALTKLKLKGYMAGLYTLLIALGVAIVAFGMPVGMALSSAVYGFAYGLW
nr:L-lactate permease [Alysiella crassa]UOP07208.1 L-lactate permease [Alysiella crassa]